MPSSLTTPYPHPLTALHPHPFIQEKRASSPCATQLLTRDLRKITSLVRCAAGAFSAYFSLFETANAAPPAGFSLRPPGGRQEAPPSKLSSWHRQSLLPAIPPLLPAISIASFPPGAPTTKSPRRASFSPLRAPRTFSLWLRAPRAFPLRLLDSRPAAPIARNELQGATRQRASASAHQRTIVFRRQSPLITSFLEARKRAEASCFGPLRSLPSMRAYAA